MTHWYRARIGRPRRWSLWAVHALDPGPVRSLTLQIHGSTLESAHPDSTRNIESLVLDDHWVLAPGLINAHDHLELNSFPLLGAQRPYGNFYQWAKDVESRWNQEPLRTARKVDLQDRLRLGGFKNLLNGVTTVCHHNPYHRCMTRRFPVQVLQKYRFLQSLEQPDPGELQRARRGNAPLFVHVADGTDVRAQAEFERLAELFPGGSEIVLVHGLGLTESQIEIAARRKYRHVWCPVSNNYLYAACAPMEQIFPVMMTALGSDSALSGSQGLLDDLRYAAKLGGVRPDLIISMVTRQSAEILGLHRSVGRLTAGCLADLLVFPKVKGSLEDSLLTLHRRDIGLVIRQGRPVYGDKEFLELFRQHQVEVVCLQVDGREKILDASLRIPWETLALVRNWTPLWQGINRQNFCH